MSSIQVIKENSLGINRGLYGASFGNSLSAGNISTLLAEGAAVNVGTDASAMPVKASIDANGDLASLLNPDGSESSLGRGEVPEYDGQVATRCMIPNQRLATAKSFNSKAFLSSRDKMVNPSFRLPNFMVATAGSTPTGSGEIGSGGQQLTTAAIEYPIGGARYALTPVNGTGVIPDNSTLWFTSTGLSIEAGEPFLLVSHGEFSGAGNPCILNTSVNDNNYTVLGERFEYSDSILADKTLSGTISNTLTGGACYGPIEVIAKTRKRSFLGFGDSRMKGLNAIGNYDGAGDVGEVFRSVGPLRAYCNAATGGSKAQELANSNAIRSTMIQHFSDVIIQPGINDLLSGRTAAQILADNNVIATMADILGKTVTFVTIPPDVSSTDMWATYSGQTPNAAIEAERIIYNTALRNMVQSKKRRLIDFADAVEVGSNGLPQRNSGRIMFNGVANAYYYDNLHETGQCNRVIARTNAVRGPLGI